MAEDESDYTASPLREDLMMWNIDRRTRLFAAILVASAAWPAHFVIGGVAWLFSGQFVAGIGTIIVSCIAWLVGGWLFFGDPK